MPFQSGIGVDVKYKVEGSFGVAAASGAGAKRFRLNAGGLGVDRALIASNEKRPDMKSSMSRYGSKNVNGGYSADLSVDTFTDLIEAVMRGTKVAQTDITQAQMTSITTTATTIVAAAGSWITQGVRVGQVHRLAGHATVANNGKNLRVIGVTALIITYAGTAPLVLDAAADTTFTLSIMPRISQPAVPIRRSFTFEEEYRDVDQSQLFVGARMSSMRISGGPDAMAIIEFGIVGADGSVLNAAATPYFTGPTVTSSVGLTLADASLRFAGEDVAIATGFDIMLDNRQSGQAVIGGNVTPDVFEGAAAGSGSLSLIRRDLQNIERFYAETELELHAMLVEPDAEPKDFVSVFAGRIKLGRPTAPLGGDNAMIETVPFTFANKDATTGYDDTMLLIGQSI